MGNALYPGFVFIEDLRPLVAEWPDGYSADAAAAIVAEIIDHAS